MRPTARPRRCWRAWRRQSRRPGPRWRTAGRGWACSCPRSAKAAEAHGGVPAGAGRPGGAGRRPRGHDDARRNLAVTLNRIGVVLVEMGKPLEAEAEYRRALAIRRKLADDNPDVAEFRSGLAVTHDNLGYLSETGRPAEAEAEYRKALAIEQAGRQLPRRHRLP